MDLSDIAFQILWANSDKKGQIRQLRSSRVFKKRMCVSENWSGTEREGYRQTDVSCCDWVLLRFQVVDIMSGQLGGDASLPCPRWGYSGGKAPPCWGLGLLLLVTIVTTLLLWECRCSPSPTDPQRWWKLLPRLHITLMSHSLIQETCPTAWLQQAFTWGKTWTQLPIYESIRVVVKKVRRLHHWGSGTEPTHTFATQHCSAFS